MVMPWLTGLVLVLVLILVLLALGGALPGGARRGEDRVARKVANSGPLLASPLVRRRLALRRGLHVLLGVMIMVCLVGAAGIAGRPVARSVHSEALASRDIVLCLDVSTSMVAVDAEVLNTFSTLIKKFDGERVALVVWNSTAQTMVPLTDDYDLLQDQFDELSEVLDFTPYYGNPDLDRYFEVFPGVLSESVSGSSLAGDGLASCTLAFDQPVEDRSRSIILATDNQVVDTGHTQVYSLSEAADLLAEQNIRLFSLFAADLESDPWASGIDVEEARAELESVTTAHNGRFYEITDVDATSSIVKELEEDQANELTADSEVRITDTPQRWVTALALGVLTLLGLTAWRRA